MAVLFAEGVEKHAPNPPDKAPPKASPLESRSPQKQKTFSM
jgi:hypothetical protein